MPFSHLSHQLVFRNPVEIDEFSIPLKFCKPPSFHPQSTFHPLPAFHAKELPTIGKENTRAELSKSLSRGWKFC